MQFASDNEFDYFCNFCFTEDVAQLVRASDCGSEGRGFETPHSPIHCILPFFNCFSQNDFFFLGV